jgi:hypothetical protein
VVVMSQWLYDENGYGGTDNGVATGFQLNVRL